MIAGVCNGMAAYINVNPTFVRLGFVLLTTLWGTGVLLYLVMAIVIPEANTAEEKAAAYGGPSTAQEFIRRAKEGYYEAMKGFPDRKARREWQRRFKKEMHGWRTSFDREMRANADQWRRHWHGAWAEHILIHPGMTFALPVLSLLHGVATVVWICALISLLATATVFGLALPAGVPVWVAALVLFIAYVILVSPLKAARRACYWGIGRSSCAWSFMFLLDAVIWLAVVAALLWLAMHISPNCARHFRASLRSCIKPEKTSGHGAKGSEVARGRCRKPGRRFPLRGTAFAVDNNGVSSDSAPPPPRGSAICRDVP